MLVVVVNSEVPYWTREEEKSLVSLAETGNTVEEICKHFHRTPGSHQVEVAALRSCDFAESKRS